MATITSIVYKPNSPENEDRSGAYLRAPLKEAQLVAGVASRATVKAGTARTGS